jgi:hypothetical protein
VRGESNDIAGKLKKSKNLRGRSHHSILQRGTLFLLWGEESPLYYSMGNVCSFSGGRITTLFFNGERLFFPWGVESPLYSSVGNVCSFPGGKVWKA